MLNNNLSICNKIIQLRIKNNKNKKEKYFTKRMYSMKVESRKIYEKKELHKIFPHKSYNDDMLLIDVNK